MTENNKTGNNSMKAVPAEGKMFLYEKPEYLSPKTHADIGWRTPSQPYAFARAVNSIPLVASEIPSAQKFYPIIFPDMEREVRLQYFLLRRGQIPLFPMMEIGCRITIFLHT